MLHELHVTVENAGDGTRWQEVCEMTGSKPLLIELIPTRSVQMMNAQAADIDPDDLPIWTADRVAALPNEYKVIRIKAEVPLDKGVTAYNQPYYHECHVKVLSDAWEERHCARLAERLGWVASRNLYFPRVLGMRKWYLTKRRYDTDALSAAKEFHEAWAKIAPNMPPAARMEMETVVNDTNPALDVGWA